MQNALNAKADIDEVAHQNNIIDNKIAQIEYKTDSLTNDTIPNTVRNVLANENVMTWSDLNQTMTNVESAINRAKNYAIETAAADANAKYVKTATFTDQVNSVLDSHGELLTADSTDLSNKINTIIAENNFVKSADFASKLRENNVLNTTDKNELATLINTAKNAAIAAADESASNKFVQNGNDLRNKVGTLLAENEVLKKADKNELVRAISDAQNAAVETAAADAASKYLTTSSTGLSERITDAVAEMGFVKNTDFADKLYENGVLNSTDKAELIAAIDALQNAQDDALTPEDVDEIITGNGFIKGNDQIITDIYGRINQNKEDIARNKENIDDTTQDINGLTSRLDSDETKINNNTSRLGDAETQITTNKTNIEKNKNRFNDYTTKEEIEADYTKTAQLAQILSGKETETNLTRAVSEMLDPFATKNSLDDYTKTSGLDGAIATAFAKNGSQLKNKVNTLITGSLDGYVQEGDLSDYLKSDSDVITGLDERITANTERFDDYTTTDDLIAGLSDDDSDNGSGSGTGGGTGSGGKISISDAMTARLGSYSTTAEIVDAFENFNDGTGNGGTSGGNNNNTNTGLITNALGGVLNNYATQTALANYPTTSDVALALDNYTTTNDLKTAFGGSATTALNTVISNKFGNYTTTANLASTIAGTISSGATNLTTALQTITPNALANYTTTNDLKTAFGGSATTALNTVISNKFGNYTTTANLAKTIAGDNSVTDLSTAIGKYTKTANLASTIAGTISSGATNLTTALQTITPNALNNYPTKTQLASAFGANSGDNFIAASQTLRTNLSSVQTSVSSANDGISAIANVLKNTSGSPFASNNIINGVAAHFPYDSTNNTMLQAVPTWDGGPN